MLFENSQHKAKVMSVGKLFKMFVSVTGNFWRPTIDRRMMAGWAVAI